MKGYLPETLQFKTILVYVYLAAQYFSYIYFGQLSVAPLVDFSIYFGGVVVNRPVERPFDLLQQL